MSDVKLVKIRFTKSTDGGSAGGAYNAGEVAGFSPDAARAFVAKDRAVYVDEGDVPVPPGTPEKTKAQKAAETKAALKAKAKAERDAEDEAKAKAATAAKAAKAKK